MPAFYSFLFLSLIVVSGEVRAHGSCPELVNFLKQTAYTEEDYNQLISNLAGDDDSKQKNLREYVNKLQESNKTPPQLATDCKQNLDKIVGSFWVRNGIASIKDAVNEAVKEVRESCETVEQLLPDEQLTEQKVKRVPFTKGLCTTAPVPYCPGVGFILIPELERVANFHKPTKFGLGEEPYSPSDCECFDEALKDRQQNKLSIIEKSGPIYARIDGLILEATGKKLLNEFAAFYEDVHYYKESSGWALDTSKDGIESTVLCSEPKDFQAAIKNKCGDSVDEIDQEARTSAILGVYGDKFKASSAEFPNSLKNLLSDFESPDKEYSRKEFDKVRFGVNSIQADVSLANKIVTSLIKNKELNLKLNKLISEGKSPLEAIKETLSATNKSDPKLLKKMLKDLNDPKVAELNESLIGVLVHEGFNQKNDIIFGRALAFNPGFKSLLLDPVSFKTVSSKIISDDFMTFAEKNGVLKSQYKERCLAIQKKLAEAVCTNPSELRDRVERKDLITLLDKNKMLASSNDGIDMALCAANRNVVDPNSVFAELDLESLNRHHLSDYHDMKNHSSQDQNSMYSRAAKNPNDPAFQRVAKAYDYQRVSSVAKGSSAASSKASSQLNPFSMLNMRDIDSLMQTQQSSPSANTKSTKVSEETRQGQTAVEAALGKVTNSFQTSVEANKAAPAVNGMGAVPFNSPKTAAIPEQSSKVQEMKPFQSELMKELSSAEPEKVKKLLSNINEIDAKELLRLREQAKSDKNEISELKLEAEKSRMAELKSEYEELEKKLDTLKKEKSSIAERPQTAGESFSASNKFASAPIFQEKSNVAYEPKATGGGQDGFNSGSDDDINSQAKSANMRNVASLAASAAPVRDVESKGDNKLIVLSSQKSGPGSDDPSGELISYLSKNETDSEALRSLKESGLLYKVEVNENGKKQVRTKLIKYNELTPEAKLLVDRRLSHLEITESKTLSELEKKVLLSKRAYSIQALKLELLSVSRQ